mmetsp:Transcript_20827/g.34419  ORF Transcript_20827/g.34419 Transcript_20827/m.34419 type:complete len:337 (-) Transcript_20827:224-1234(-)
MASLQGLKKPAFLALAFVPPVWAFVAFGKHDRRDLDNNEVKTARQSLARLSPKHEPQSDTSSLVIREEHLRNVKHFGATVIKGSLSSRQVQEWHETSIQVFAHERSVLSRGRLHCDVSSKRSKYHKDLARMGGEEPPRGAKCNQNELIPQLVRAYFSQRGSPRYKLTQLQFLNANSGSEHQIWHRDNISPGLTVLVALSDVRDNGPTELLLKSHLQKSLWSTLKREWMDLLEKSRTPSEKDVSSCQPLLACLNEGDAILYDSRVLHRGRGFSCKEGVDEHTDANHILVDRPVLVLRWDALQTPPPGAGLIVTTANGYMGSVLTASLLCISKLLQLS